MTNESLWLITAIIFMILSMGWLALSKPTHWQQVEMGKPRSSRLRFAGWVALILSAACCLQADHASMAVLVWFMLIAAASFSIGMLLSMKPYWLKCLTIKWISTDIFFARK